MRLKFQPKISSYAIVIQNQIIPIELAHPVQSPNLQFLSLSQVRCE